MTKSKSTKRALVSSTLAILMCMAMLIGTTFAWFTDTASTAVNKIQSGKLDVALEMSTDGGETWESAEGKTLDFIKSSEAPEDEAILWEPGCTYELPELRVVNEGNLALKYKVTINGVDGDAKLLEAIDFTVKKGDTEASLKGWEGVLLPENAEKKLDNEEIWITEAITISGHMKEEAGNEYQDKTIEGIGITVVATQYTYEYDSDKNTYDEKAEYPVAITRDELNTTLTLTDIPVSQTTGKHMPMEISLGNTVATDIAYSEHYTGYTGKGVQLGNTNLNKYGAAPAAEGEYTFIFKDGTIKSAATGYDSIDKLADTSVYMLVPGNSDVVFENMTFEGVVSFDIQKYTSPWSHLNSIAFKNCTFKGIIVGCCPASNVTIDGCTFENYTNTTYANNSNPIWWRADYEGEGSNATYIKNFTFVNNKVTSTRPVKIERIGRDGCDPVFTFKNNTFDISAQAGDTVTKNMAINIGQWDKSSKFTLIDEGNTISANTASLYTAALGNGSNQYIAVSGNKVLDGNGNNKTITAMVWKTTNKETFQMKTID